MRAVCTSILNPNRELAAVAGIPVQPSLLDNLFSMYTANKTYKGIPENRLAAFSFVLRKVAERSVYLTKKDNMSIIPYIT